MTSRSVFAVFSALMMSLPLAVQAGKVEQSAIVVPAHHSYLQLAVDVSRFDPVTVIGFRQNKQTGEVRLFVWNDHSKGWSRLALADYQSGKVFNNKATRLILVDTDETVPTALEALSPSIKETAHLKVSTIGDMVNKLAPIFKFSESEWESLASWNKLELTDHNVDRRRYGRWGKSDDEAKAAPPEVVTPAETKQVEAVAPVAAKGQTEYDDADKGDADTAASALPTGNVVSQKPETTPNPEDK